MTRIMTNDCKKYIQRLSPSDKTRILISLVSRMMETEEVSFMDDDYDKEDGFEPFLYWSSCGDDLLKDEA